MKKIVISSYFSIALLPLVPILFFVNSTYGEVGGGETDNRQHELNITEKSGTSNESKILVTQVCKKYSELKLEWCEMDLNDDNSPLIIIGNNTITTISKLKWNGNESLK